MSMCRVIFCVVGRCLLWLTCSLLAFALLHFELQGQTYLLLQVSLDFLLCILVPYDEKDIFLVLILDGLVGHHRTVQLLWHYWLGHRLTVILNGLPWKRTEIILSWLCDFTFTFNCISHSFVDHKSYSISSKGFLPTVIDREEVSFAELQFDFFKKNVQYFLWKYLNV